MAQLFETLGDLLHFTAHYREAQDAYETALTAAAATTGQNPIWGCRLQRKIGSACLPQHHYKFALQYFDRAQAALGSEPATAEIAWWREWIGGVVLVICAIAHSTFACFAAGHNHAFAMLISGGPYLLTGILFLWSWRKSRSIGV